MVDEAIRKEQLTILSQLVDINQDISTEFEAQILICNTMAKLREENNLKNYGISTFVKDLTKIKWKQNRATKNEFTKIFHNEISSAIELYGLTKSEVLFLYSLSSYLLWEENLLVDAEGKPLNQKRLCEELELGRKAVSQYIISLEKKKCLIRIWHERNTYFLINPFLMFKGKKIYKVISDFFKIIGYEYKELSDKSI